MPRIHLAQTYLLLMGGLHAALVNDLDGDFNARYFVSGKLDLSKVSFPDRLSK